MWLPSWLWVGTPVKFALWVFNRVATATGVLYFWKRLRASRYFWFWLFLINAVSLGFLVLFFFWLHHRHSG